MVDTVNMAGLYIYIWCFDLDSRTSIESSTAAVRKELDDLEHDQAVLSQILFLVSSLKQNYKVCYTAYIR